LRTIPCSETKSSTRDSVLSSGEIVLRSSHPAALPRPGCVSGWATGPREAYLCACTRKGNKSSRSGTGSGLEAFSHKPTDDSVPALPVQAADVPIIWLRCSSRTDLNYHCDDPSSVG